jgi:hypothetical protein
MYERWCSRYWLQSVGTGNGLVRNMPFLPNHSDSKVKANAPGPYLMKTLLIVVPPSVLPDLFPHHAHLAFAVGIIGGCFVQYFVPPRGRYLVVTVLLAIAAVVLNLIFVK